MRIAGVAVLSMLSVVGCHGDFLTGGELDTDPNRPVVATSSQLFEGIEAQLWALLGGDPARVTGILAQQFTGGLSQYAALNDYYTIDANTTNGFQAGLYGGGGLVDIQKLEKASKAVNDSIFLGIAEVQEGLLMGTGADLYGDLVYSQALQNKPNPTLDSQLTVYDSVQKVLSAAILNLNSTPNAINVGPGSNDLVYGNLSPVQQEKAWQALAYTLKARFYMHTAKVNGQAAYQGALTNAQHGIMNSAMNYQAIFFDLSVANRQNFYWQLQNTAGRAGYLLPNEGFDRLLESRNDPRRTQYFQIVNDSAVQISATRFQPNYNQPLVTADENTLIWSEAAYRTGDQGTALLKLNQERADAGLPPESGANTSGMPLLNEILTEEYINDFQLGVEPWILYLRTCTPNLVPAPGATSSASGGKIPGRLFYDTSELSTDSNYPAAGTGVNGYRNRATPPSTTSDGTGQPCLGQ